MNSILIHNGCSILHILLVVLNLLLSNLLPLSVLVDYRFHKLIKESFEKGMKFIEAWPLDLARTHFLNNL